MEQEPDRSATQAVLDQIKKDPTLAISSKKDLERVINERETADIRIKKSGRSLILYQQVA